MLAPISASQQHAFLQADTSSAYARPICLNRKCAPRASKSELTPLPRNILLVCVPLGIPNPRLPPPAHVIFRNCSVLLICIVCASPNHNPCQFRERASEVSASHVLWLESCCYEHQQGAQHGEPIPTYGASHLLMCIGVHVLTVAHAQSLKVSKIRSRELQPHLHIAVLYLQPTAEQMQLRSLSQKRSCCDSRG